MDIPNNNVDSDADSNISQILLSDDDRKPSAQKDPPPADTSVKKKASNLGSALFSHQKNNVHFSSSSSDDDDSIKNPPNNKKAPPTNKAPNKKDPPNHCQKAMKALLMKKYLYTRAIKTTFLVKLKGLSLSDLHQNKHSSVLIKLQTKAITKSGPTVSQRQQNWNTKFMVPILNNRSTSTFQTQTIKYFLDQIEKDFDGATNQYIEQMEAVAVKARQMKEKKARLVANFVEYDITKGDTFPCPKCGHMMIMQLNTTETIAAYNQKSPPKPRRTKYKEQRFACHCHKQHCMMVDKGGNCVRCRSKYQTGVELLNPGGEGCSRQICNCQYNVVFTESTRPVIDYGVDPKELEEDTAPNTMPGLVLMIHDSIAEATCAKFLEDTTASKARYHLQCLLLCLLPNGQQPPSWICKVPENYQGSNGRVTPAQARANYSAPGGPRGSQPGGSAFGLIGSLNWPADACWSSSGDPNRDTHTTEQTQLDTTLFAGHEFPDDYVFSSEEKASITSEDIYKFMALKVYGKEDPTGNDNPTLGWSSTLTYYKKAISQFMISQSAWCEATLRGNPMKLECASEEFMQIVDMIFAQGHLMENLHHQAMLKFQLHLSIARIDDMAHVQKKNLQKNLWFLQCLCIRLKWCKNVQDKRNCLQQLLIGSMNSKYCVFIGLAVFLEKLWLASREARQKLAFENAVSACIKSAVFEREVSGKLGTHSIQKYGTSKARMSGVRYEDPDISAAVKLCHGGLYIYKTVEGSGFGPEVAKALGLALLWAMFDAHASDLVPPDIRHQVTAKYIQLEAGLEDGVNPVKKVTVFASEHGGCVSLDEIEDNMEDFMARSGQQ
eukprot:jgi/Psemu1/6971/gm1.6971_g